MQLTVMNSKIDTDHRLFSPASDCVSPGDWRHAATACSRRHARPSTCSDWKRKVWKACSLTSMIPQSIARAVDTVLARTDGRLYALFNNGAYGQAGAVEDLSRAALRAQFETNLFGWHELTNRILPVMRNQGYGRIIHNSSVLGFVALRFRGAYTASKYALEGLTDTLRLELAGSGIHVVLIEPGPVSSRFRANAHAAYQRNIDARNSHFREHYLAMEQRLTTAGPVVPFTLPPEAVLKKVIRALESRRPRPRYHVTFPTHLFALLKRVLTQRALDRVLSRI